jgi:hypothetical protein
MVIDHLPDQLPQEVPKHLIVQNLAKPADTGVEIYVRHTDRSESWREVGNLRLGDGMICFLHA